MIIFLAAKFLARITISLFSPFRTNFIFGLDSFVNGTDLQSYRGFLKESDFSSQIHARVKFTNIYVCISQKKLVLHLKTLGVLDCV